MPDHVVMWFPRVAPVGRPAVDLLDKLPSPLVASPVASLWPQPGYRDVPRRLIPSPSRSTTTFAKVPEMMLFSLPFRVLATLYRRPL